MANTSPSHARRVSGTAPELAVIAARFSRPPEPVSTIPGTRRLTTKKATAST